MEFGLNFVGKKFWYYLEDAGAFESLEKINWNPKKNQRKLMKFEKELEMFPAPPLNNFKILTVIWLKSVNFIVILMKREFFSSATLILKLPQLPKKSPHFIPRKSGIWQKEDPHSQSKSIDNKKNKKRISNFMVKIVKKSQ